jgi:hypothetical protein
VLFRSVNLGSEGKANLAPDWRAYYERHVGRYFDHNWTDENFTEDILPATVGKLLLNIAKAAASPNFQFLPLFNFTYADGHPMVTIGGMVGTEKEAGMIKGCDFNDAEYIRFDEHDDQYRIRVPRFTRKEKLHLDSHMPHEDGWMPKEFKIALDDLEHYRKIYRFYPTYVEMLL